MAMADRAGLDGAETAGNGGHWQAAASNGSTGEEWLGSARQAEQSNGQAWQQRNGWVGLAQQRQQRRVEDWRGWQRQASRAQARLGTAWRAKQSQQWIGSAGRVSQGHSVPAVARCVALWQAMDRRGEYRHGSSAVVGGGTAGRGLGGIVKAAWQWPVKASNVWHGQSSTGWNRIGRQGHAAVSTALAWQQGHGLERPALARNGSRGKDRVGMACSAPARQQWQA